MVQIKELEKLTKLVRYFILESTTKAGSGHPSSSISAAELGTTLFFGGFFRFNPQNPDQVNNDRFILSKGHAAPLLYSLWAAAGKLSEKELMSLRKFGSPIEGHPTMQFPYTEAATGSLGQGLSLGLGMALNAKLDKLSYKTYVLMGDGEMAEGSIWEAMQLAAHYKLNNLIGVIDVNRLGQRGQTMYGHDLKNYKRKVESFGWEAILVDGHSIKQIIKAYTKAQKSKKPVMIIAKTFKGNSIPGVEDQNGWHGVPLKEEAFEEALKSLGHINISIRGEMKRPENLKCKTVRIKNPKAKIYKKGDKEKTREAYGNALLKIHKKFPEMVVLDAEVSNSTYTKYFAEQYPKKFFEMFIAEQNMLGAALGFCRRGKIPFVSTFAAFLTRAHDQIRMSQYSNPNIKICGSHAGVSIGQDGSSQMGLEDIAMMRSILDSVVLYPSDAVSTEKLVEAMAKHKGLAYIRTTRNPVPVLYNNTERFRIGGSKVLKKSSNDVITIIAAGITLHEAMKAHEELKNKGINARIIDLYSIKPLDKKTIHEAADKTRHIITVEDHFIEGGIGETIKSELAGKRKGTTISCLAVTKMPRSGQMDELLNYEGISSNYIVKKAEEILS